MYGLMLLLAIAACVGLTGIRYVRRGGDWDLVLRVAVWGVAFGIVGARLYHDVTSWSEVPDPKWQGIFEVWKGGLGVWGGILFGCDRRRDRRPALGPQRQRVRGRGRARAPARAGDRPDRQLVQPGALRQADRQALGARDRRPAPRPRVRGSQHLPADLPLRADLQRVDGRRASAHRLALPDPCAGAVRALRLALHVRPLLRGAPSDRPRARVRRLCG